VILQGSAPVQLEQRLPPELAIGELGREFCDAGPASFLLRHCMTAPAHPGPSCCIGAANTLGGRPIRAVIRPRSPARGIQLTGSVSCVANVLTSAPHRRWNGADPAALPV